MECRQCRHPCRMGPRQVGGGHPLSRLRRGRLRTGIPARFDRPSVTGPQVSRPRVPRHIDGVMQARRRADRLYLMVTAVGGSASPTPAEDRASMQILRVEGIYAGEADSTLHSVGAAHFHVGREGGAVVARRPLLCRAEGLAWTCFWSLSLFFFFFFCTVYL